MAGNGQKTCSVVPPNGKQAIHCQLDPEEKRTLYRILKRLLTNPHSLQEGEWGQDNIVRHMMNKTCELVYGKKSCVVSVFNQQTFVQRSGEAAALDIYLRWREGEPEEVLSLANLQRAQNELAFLGIGGPTVTACFNLVKHKLVKEPYYSMKHNCRLQIFCDEVILAFCSGHGMNMMEITVLYDDRKSTAVCHAARWEDGKCTVVTSSL